MKCPKCSSKNIGQIGGPGGSYLIQCYSCHAHSEVESPNGGDNCLATNDRFGKAVFGTNKKRK